MQAPASPRIGVSSCLAGERVRYDGRDKKHAYITQLLSAVCELIPVCPEVGIGMGVPRPPIQLVGNPDDPSARGLHDPAVDVSRPLRRYARSTVRAYPELAGYIFKSRSPSCAVSSVNVMSRGGRLTPGQAGLYARELIAAKPALPVIEETQLADPLALDNFLERVFVYQRWLLFRRRRLTAKGLYGFHQQHRLLVRSHGMAACRTMDAFVQGMPRARLPQFARRYIESLMRALQLQATRKRHYAVLTHVAKALARQLPAAKHAQLAGAVEAYRLGRATRLETISLIERLLRQAPNDALMQQVYLFPDPVELQLRAYD